MLIRGRWSEYRASQVGTGREIIQRSKLKEIKERKKADGERKGAKA